MRTPHVEKEYATVSISTEIDGAKEGETFELDMTVLDEEGNVVARRTDSRAVCHGESVRQNLTVNAPKLWSPENPALYTARVKILKDGAVIDNNSVRFGIRTAEFIADKGFFLNGERRVIRGVCMHHDLGPLGAAVNRSR